MADEHNPERYGETWPQHRINSYLEVCTALKHSVVFSGGWAWHFLSPPGHPEYKHAHNHKDLDLMVPPRTVSSVMSILKGLGFEKVRTKYDGVPSKEDFRRYEKVVGDEFRLTIDFFVKDVPILQVPGGWLVVRPDELLGYYNTIHSSKTAWAVTAARLLFEHGASPEDLIHDPQLMCCPTLDMHFCTKCGWSGQFPEQKNFMVCGGCKKYIPHNMGKPKFRPRPEQMNLARDLLRQVKF